MFFQKSLKGTRGMDRTNVPERRDADLLKPGTAAVLISLVAAISFVMHTWYPGWFPIDALGAGLLVVVALPWLRGIIKSVEIPGFAKMELQETKEVALLAKGTAESTQRQLDAFLPNVGRDEPENREASSGGGHAQLATDYNRIREKERSGEERTKRMDELFHRMVRMSADATPQEICAWLESDDRGSRLLGYAASYASPDEAPINELIDSITVKE